MGYLIHLVCWIACIQVVQLFPVQEDIRPLYEDYRMKMAKKESFGPFKESLLTSLGLLENSKEGTQSQRKKAVDSTFIRFGRSSAGQTLGRDNLQEPNAKPFPDTQGDVDISSPEIPDAGQSGYLVNSPRRPLLDHNGCRITSSKELVRALMNDRNCIRAFEKVKRENVNDTFIRFGKREAPPEKEFEPVDSNESR